MKTFHCDCHIACVNLYFDHLDPFSLAVNNSYHGVHRLVNILHMEWRFHLLADTDLSDLDHHRDLYYDGYVLMGSGVYNRLHEVREATEGMGMRGW